MNARRQRAILKRIARLAMLERGLLPCFSAESIAELDRIQDPPPYDREERMELPRRCTEKEDDAK